ncbi:hypothetical protein [Parathalassolituus penaei]|uniref:Uncharacterized protein n=1 Tax=Parathalassolituus penaei TaxID=2997323 RepID=A0A9X3ISA3_9GAMM|nr:hypothetical protein [Parathalassolituus penaei]MCY0963938.1 hypothetical protein [Parathalassolituus penaei]
MASERPAPRIAMQQLITEVRDTLPFHLPPSELCQHSCSGCPKKLMEFMETELSEQEMLLDAGDEPTLGDINRLARTSRKVYNVMQKNGLVQNAMEITSSSHPNQQKTSA